MIFIAPQTDFAALQPTYEAMLKSVQFPVIGICGTRPWSIGAKPARYLVAGRACSRRCEALVLQPAIMVQARAPAASLATRRADRVDRRDSARRGVRPSHGSSRTS
jgi:hypothetical protein